jgi:serine/threonine protein kinase
MMVGQTVSHYRILERLGAGGMGIVYRAEDTTLKRQVALKFLPRDDTLLPHAEERFLHEARAASALDHPNICTIHEIAKTEEGQLFLVMSCYEGETLRARLQRQALTVNEAIAIAAQLCDGLGAAHERKIVHRDLKPDNIMILSNGLVKILDFGLAKFLGQTKLTTEGTTLGTIAYMSPEQVQSSDVDHRSDIYSLCVILYEMLTGEIPFKAEHHMATFYLIVNVMPPGLRSINPAIPDALERTVLLGMEKEKEKRHQNCSLLKQQLLPFSPAQIPSPPPSPTRRESVEELRSGGKTRLSRGTIIGYAGAGAVLLVFLLSAIFFFGNSKHPNGRMIARAHRDRAILLMDSNQLAGSQLELDSALEADPSYALGWSTAAAVNVRLGNLDLAIRQGMRAVALDSTSANAFYNLAYALEERGELDDALAYYGRVVRIDSLYMPAQSARASLCTRMGRADEATMILHNALRMDSVSRYSYLLYRNLGNAHLAAGRPDESIVAVTKSMELQPDQGAEPLYILAGAYQAKGMLAKTRALLRTYIATESDSARRSRGEKMMRDLPG